MCNPRRVMVHLRESIEQAWRTTIEESAEMQVEVRERARVAADIPLDAEMGDLALQMMVRLMQGEFDDYAAWDQDADGNYRRELDAVTLIYVPGTRQLLIETSLVEQVSVAAQASAEASGFTIGDVATEAVGHYYDDGWGGRTETRARAEANRRAAERLQAAVEELHRQQNPDAFAAATAEARERAEAQAAEQLAAAQAETRAALREQMQNTLADAEDTIYRTMNHLVGEAYRRSLIEIARQSGGHIVTDERNGSIINLEVEIY
ncbi:MAG: hypothetical protein ACPG8W_10385 [Candidatus Promineifilaceae bacterium]